MAFKLIAATMTDGNGIVADKSGDVYLVKPPFDFDSKKYLSAEQIRQTISQFGFTELNEELPSWTAVFERLRQIAWKARRDAGDTNTTISEEDRKAFFRSIPEGFLIGAVERIEAYFQNNELTRVVFAGEALLENTNLLKLPELYKRVETVVLKAKVIQREKVAAVFPNVNMNTLRKNRFVPSFALVA